jgi:heme-degrading monooxygenase HmoA
MIVRQWHGRVPSAKAAQYREFLKARALPDYCSVPGLVSAHVLERSDGEVTHFVTLTFWDGMESIRRFAGDDVEKAKYYDEDRDFLLEFEPRVLHFEVAGQALPPAAPEDLLR